MAIHKQDAIVNVDCHAALAMTNAFVAKTGLLFQDDVAFIKISPEGSGGA